MSTAQVAPATTPQELLVTVRNSAAIKLEFLRALAKKLIAASQKGIEATINFARRVWSSVPTAVSGAMIAGLTSTRAGYDSVVRAARKAVNSATGILGSAFSFINRALTWVGEKIANAVGYVYAPAGNVLHRVNNFFTKLRYNLVEWVQNTYKTVAMVVNGSVKHETTRALVMGGSMAITTGMMVNTFAGGLASKFVSSIPVVGGLLSASFIGNGPAIAIGLMALVGAGISMFFNGREIVQNEIIESIMEERDAQSSAERIVAIVSNEQDRRVNSTEDIQFIMSEDDWVEKTISPITFAESIVTESHGNLAVLVQGEVTVEQAEEIAEATVNAEIAQMESQILNRNAYPAKKNHNKKRR